MKRGRDDHRAGIRDFLATGQTSADRTPWFHRIPDHCECPICLDVLIRPVQPAKWEVINGGVRIELACSAKHVACEACLVRCNQCPLCRTPFNCVLRSALHEEIDQLPVECHLSDRCPFQGPFKHGASWRAHDEECPFKVIQCQYGCGSLVRKDQQTHDVDSMAVHLQWAVDEIKRLQQWLG